MRGVKLVMIPTTLMVKRMQVLLKTCINGRQTKNLVGTLFMPLYVYNNIHILKTADRYSHRQAFRDFKWIARIKKLIRCLEQYARDSLENDPLLKTIETIKVR